jgi:uncharacterized membrane protein
MRRTIPEHGYTLVVVIVLLTVLMVLGAGAIRMAGAGTRGAIAQRSNVTVAACARAARDAIKSQIRFMNPLPQEFSLELMAGNDVVQTIRDGHPEGLPTLGDITSVEFLTDAALGTARSPSLHPRISNDILPASEFTGSAMRVVAVCTDDVGRTHEVEFLLRYGL